MFKVNPFVPVLLLVMIANAAMAQESWQDRILAFPYGVAHQPNQCTLLVLRQDHEDLEINRNVLRGPLTIGERQFPRGIGTHSVSHIRLTSPRPIQRFSAWIGVDNNRVTNPGHPIGSVVFRLEAGGRELFRSEIMWAGQEAQQVDVEVGGGQVLDLHVGDGGNGAACDWADWAAAAITWEGGRTVPLEEMRVNEVPRIRYPFSFTYDGQASDLVLDRSRRDRHETALDAGRTRLTTTWTDPKTGLCVVMEALQFSDFPAVEWLLSFQNTGEQDTPILRNLQAMDLTFGDPISRGEPFRLLRTKGSVVNPSDFEPTLTTIDPRQPEVMSGGSGKSSAKHFPFFRVDTAKATVIVAVGWSGQWEARLECPSGKRLRVTAGQQQTHFRLHPGERVRAPRILILHWQGEPVASHSQFRRLIYKHYAAKRDGDTPLPIPYCNTCFTRGGHWLNECNAENQISLIRAYSKLGLEALLTDAGWFEGGWPAGAGNWTPRRDAYPNGIQPVALAAKEEGMIYGLWFEPERVVAGTALHRDHPDWLLTDGSPNQKTLLANFGLPEVQDYFFGIIKGFMDIPGFRVYRQDFNMYPVNWWRHHDAPDRQGITEMKYIEGLYAYWDRIAETWPDSLRVECASGGMRIDLETVMRMHVHQKTDYWFDNDADQAHLFGLSQYLPNGLVVAHLNRLDDYSFHSTMASSLCLGWIADDPDFDVERGRQLLQRYLDLRHLLVGDWYPLLPYTRKPTEWMAAQYHRPDLEEGMIVAFRHPGSPYPGASVSLHGLDADATYELVSQREGKRTIQGAKLLAGFLLQLDEPNTSTLIHYRKQQ